MNRIRSNDGLNGFLLTPTLGLYFSWQLVGHCIEGGVGRWQWGVTFHKDGNVNLNLLIAITKGAEGVQGVEEQHFTF